MNRYLLENSTSAGYLLESGLGVLLLEAIIAGDTLPNTTASFTQPAIGATVTVAVDSSAAFVTNAYAYVGSAGLYRVTAIPNATSVTLQNVAIPINAAAASTIASAQLILPCGKPADSAFTEFDNGNSGTAKTIDWSISPRQKLTLTGNATLTESNLDVNPKGLLRLIQDATGGRSVTWPAARKWQGGSAPILSTSAAALDRVSHDYNGTVTYGDAGIGYA